MKCKFEHDGDCCNRDSVQYMCHCKPDICQSIVPINRYQMIRTLDDEQLFEFFLAVSKCVGCPPTNPSVCVDNCKDCWANYLESTDMIEDYIEGTQTADPETLPIVQKLRKELARVTAERDAAVKELQGVVDAVNEVDDFIDAEIYSLVPYDKYCALRDNVDAISIWILEKEWKGTK